VTNRTSSLLADGVSPASALVSGYHLAYLIGVGLVGFALVIALVVIRQARPAAARAPADAEAETTEAAYGEAA
jgi:hypothetical protein